MRIRKVLVCGGLLGMLLSLSGCPSSTPDGGGEDPSTSSAKKDWGPPVEGGQLVARYIGDAKGFNPVLEESVADSAVNVHIFPYLTSSGFENCEITTPPMLASSWEWSNGAEGVPGGKTLTYHLRDDVVWSDGTPVTSADVLFSYDTYRDTKIASPRYAYTLEIDEISAPDDHTVVFDFKQHLPTDLNLFHTGLGIIPKHVLGSVDSAEFRTHPYKEKPVTASAYQVTSWRPSERIVLDRCENCTLRPRPYLDRLIIEIIPEETVALVALKRGKIDFMELSTYAPIKDIKKNHPEINIVKRGYRFMDYVAWNFKDPEALKKARAALKGDEKLDLDAVPAHPLFGDIETRRALTMAIDVKGIMEAVTTVDGETYGRPATGTITPELCKDYADIDPFPYDPEESRRILAAKGWSDTDGDDILDRDGVSFEFTMNYNVGNTRRRDACVFIQSMLKQVGIQVNVEPIESSVFFDNLRKKDFHAALAGWSAALVIDPTDIWHSGPEYAFNFTSFKNTRVDELIEAGIKELDPLKRRAIWIEMQKEIYDDQPYTFLYWYNGIALAHNRFQNMQSNVLTAYYHLHEWWVPEELRKY